MIVFDLELTGNRAVRLDRWAVLNLLFFQIYMQRLFDLVPLPKSVGREQNQTAGQPRSRIHDLETNRPALLVKIEILHMAYVAIQRGEFVAVEFFDIL